MLKIKTKKAAAKRFRKKASGKIKFHKANKQHILTKKTTARKRRLRKLSYVDSSSIKSINRCLPNG